MPHPCLAVLRERQGEMTPYCDLQNQARERDPRGWLAQMIFRWSINVLIRRQKLTVSTFMNF